MRIRLTQIDGSLPNLALMRLASYFRGAGAEVVITRDLEPRAGEGRYLDVFGSAIFTKSAERIAKFKAAFPQAIIGGTGTENPITVEDIIGTHRGFDYAGYPDFPESIGFTQRGCRMHCPFCVVPAKEGANVSTGTLEEIWRGPGHPKKIHLLDNDFFGQPAWRERIAEAKAGGYKVCFSQGVNARLIGDEEAASLASIEYRDTKFARRRLYTAWDNLRDEKIFFAGVDRLEAAGIPPSHLMAYMLIGFDPAETWDMIWRRFFLMTERGIRPYPMVYDSARLDLKAFQRWVVMGLYRIIPFSKYDRGPKDPAALLAYLLS